MHRTYHRLLFFCALSLLFGCSRSGVCHDSTAEGCTDLRTYCQTRPPQTCNGCASDPRCGWCGSPQTGASACMPGTSEDKPNACTAEWTHSTVGCPVPPPAPER